MRGQAVCHAPASRTTQREDPQAAGGSGGGGGRAAGQGGGARLRVCTTRLEAALLKHALAHKVGRHVGDEARGSDLGGGGGGQRAGAGYEGQTWRAGRVQGGWEQGLGGVGGLWHRQAAQCTPRERGGARWTRAGPPRTDGPAGGGCRGSDRCRPSMEARLAMEVWPDG